MITRGKRKLEHPEGQEVRKIHLPISTKSAPVTLVPDVLALIALQIERSGDFASFARTCKAWHQATVVDNAETLSEKIYVFNPSTENRVYGKIIKALFRVSNFDGIACIVRHGGAGRRIDPWARETAEGYWIKLGFTRGRANSIHVINRRLLDVAYLHWTLSSQASFGGSARCKIPSKTLAPKVTKALGPRVSMLGSLPDGLPEVFKKWTSVEHLLDYIGPLFADQRSECEEPTKEGLHDPLARRIYDLWEDAWYNRYLHYGNRYL